MTITAPKPWPHPASLSDDDLLADCDMSKNRSSGPGGQHRNKVESQVILLHRPTGLDAQAAERRSSHENKRVALRRLRLILAVEHRQPVPPGEVGSELWKSRRKQGPKPRIEEVFPGIKVRTAAPGAPPGAGSSGRIACSPDHADFAALLAEALDVIADAGWDLKRASIRLDVSMSQLLKLIKDYPPALLKLNAEREKRGLRSLK